MIPIFKSAASSNRTRSGLSVLRVAAAVLVTATVTVACATTASPPRTSTLGPASDACLDRGSDCTRHSQCCTFWCVNGACEAREP